jgi:hypothetical protein
MSGYTISELPQFQVPSNNNVGLSDLVPVSRTSIQNAEVSGTYALPGAAFKYTAASTGGAVSVVASQTFDPNVGNTLVFKSISASSPLSVTDNGVNVIISTDENYSTLIQNLCDGLENYVTINQYINDVDNIYQNISNNTNVTQTLNLSVGNLVRNISNTNQTINAVSGNLVQNINNTNQTLNLSVGNLVQNISNTNQTINAVSGNLVRNINNSTQLINISSSVLSAINLSNINQTINAVSGNLVQNINNTNQTLSLSVGNLVQNISNTNQTINAVSANVINNFATTKQVINVSSAVSAINLSNVYQTINAVSANVINNFATTNQVINISSAVLSAVNNSTVNQSISALSAYFISNFGTISQNIITQDVQDALNNSNVVQNINAVSAAFANNIGTVNQTIAVSTANVLQNILSTNQIINAVSANVINNFATTNQVINVSSAVLSAVNIGTVNQNINAVSAAFATNIGIVNQSIAVSTANVLQNVGTVNQNLVAVSANYLSNTGIINQWIQASAAKVISNQATVNQTLNNSISQSITATQTVSGNVLQLQEVAFGNTSNIVIDQLPSGAFSLTSYIAEKSSLPVKVVQLEEQATNSGGGRNNIFICVDGTMRVVGANLKGELGIGDTGGTFITPIMPSYIPLLAPVAPLNTSLAAEASRFSGETIVKVKTLGTNIFAITSNGRVYVSGDNSTQQLANALSIWMPSGVSTTQSNVFVEIPLSKENFNSTIGAYIPSDPVIDIVMGTGAASYDGTTGGTYYNNTNCTYYALTQSGRVWVWGDNSHNQAGLCLPNSGGAYLDSGTIKISAAYIPDQWAWLSTHTQQAAVTAAMGTSFSTVGGVAPYIAMQQPLLGATLNKTGSAPYTLNNTGAVAVSALYSCGSGYSTNHNAQTTYAIDVNGKVWYWGNNDCGQIGNGFAINIGQTPYPKQLTAYTIGGITIQHLLPFVYDGIAPVKKIVTGSGAYTGSTLQAQTWLITYDGRVYGAGANGIYNSTDLYSCIGATYDVYTGSSYQANFTDQGQYQFFDTKHNITGFTQVYNTSPWFVYDVVAHTDTNYTTAFALVTAGTISGGPFDGQPYFNLLCWGDNTSGQLGLGNNTTPVQTTSATSVDHWPWLGGYYSAASGSLSGLYVAPAGVVKVAIAGNDQYKTTLVLDTLGRLWSAGYGGSTANSNTQTGILGQGYSTQKCTSFRQVSLNPNLGNVVDIVSTNNGYNHYSGSAPSGGTNTLTTRGITANFLVLLDSGAVFGWGWNATQSLGIGIQATTGYYANVSVPTQVKIIA